MQEVRYNYPLCLDQNESDLQDYRCQSASLIPTNIPALPENSIVAEATREVIRSLELNI